jgi:orotate phosphoribosyltransferase
LLSRPIERTSVRDCFVEEIKSRYPDVQILAGVATGAIGMAALIAQALELPMIYVRSEAKKHGLTNMIEGDVDSGQNVVVIEDLISTGGSSLKAVKALREKGCHVRGMAAIFTYGFDEAVENFKKEKCQLETLTSYDTLIAVAHQREYITDKDVKSLQKWRANPVTWGENLVK